MVFERYRLFYFNIILCLLFIFNQFFLFFLVLYIKLPYLLNLEHEFEYQFDFFYPDYEENEKYNEFDIDDEFSYTLVYTELYLLSNCRFFFDIFGGPTILDNVDFIEFTIYKNNEDRNKKYIYENTYIYENLSKLDYNMKSNLKKEFIESTNENFFIKYLKEDDVNNKRYNILKNVEIKENIKYKQRYIYLKKYNY